MNPSPLILPVIHFQDTPLALVNAAMARQSGADGVFLISHHVQDEELPAVAEAIKRSWPGARVGLNFLSRGLRAAMSAVERHGLDMLWGDRCGVSAQGLDDDGRHLRDWAARNPAVTVYAGVAFKYQRPEPDPAGAARQAREAGMLPTTSGAATGSAPNLDKIRSMSEAVDGQLAVASGMTAANVGPFAPLLHSILVSTGVSLDEVRFDPLLLVEFVKAVRSAS